ncbi:nuclear factor of activated T-cells, cytoplasmic 3 isoform X1 [Tachysurus ichikawai]
MSSADCSGNEELDFRLIFGEDGQHQPPPGPAGTVCKDGTDESLCADDWNMASVSGSRLFPGARHEQICVAFV